MADAYIAFWQNEKNNQKVDRLLELGVKIEEKEEFANKTFVITGTLTNYTRDEMKSIIENFGGHTSESVSKKTDVVIVGDNPGSKYDKAQKLGITIWDDDYINQIMEEYK